MATLWATQLFSQSGVPMLVRAYSLKPSPARSRSPVKR